MAEVAYAVLRVDDEGATYFDDEVVQLVPTVYVPGIPLVDTAEPFAATAFVIFRCEANYVSDWHPAPRRQFVLVLEGGFEVTSGRGETRTFPSGALFLVEDVHGSGHQTKTIGGEPCVFATVACPLAA
jgi:quercetin dioxygenase-like cupin family protein